MSLIFRLSCHQILRRLSCHLVVGGQLFIAAILHERALIAEQNEPNVVEADKNRSDVKHIEV